MRGCDEVPDEGHFRVVGLNGLNVSCEGKRS